MIAQPTSAGTSSDIAEELRSLRGTIDNAIIRIQNLEEAASRNASRLPLFPIDSPAMVLAKRLAGEIFPGPVEIEIACAPDEPEATWYALTVLAHGNAQKIVDDQLRWARQLDQQFPTEASDIRLSVKLA